MSGNSKEIKINYYSEWDQVNIHYRNDRESWTKVPGVLMKKTSEKWFSLKIKAENLEFVFNNGKEWHNLGKVTRDKKVDVANFRTSKSEVWLKNGIIYDYNPELTKVKGKFIILTLNLHTYQETNQDEKFNKIAEAINNLDPDIICFQEVGENWNDGNRDWESNMAKIINDRTGGRFHMYFDWSHIGFELYREGSAILSKYEFISTESRYVSRNTNIHSYTSRKIVKAQVEVPNIGKVNVFSVHTGWASQSFKIQVDNIKKWVEELKGEAGATFLCGDFNVQAGKDNYKYMIEDEKYIDQYYKANPLGFNDATIDGSDWQDGKGGKRIDYIFMNKDSKLETSIVQRIFTEKSYGMVSDHNGQYGIFNLK